MPEYPIPPPEEQLRNVINRWDKRHGKHWTETKDGPEPRFLEFVEKHKHEIGPKVLDIGSGGGRHFVPLLQMGYEVTGLDSSEVGIEETKEKLQKLSSEDIVTNETGINLVRGDFHHLPFEDESFNSAISIQVLHNNDWPGAVQAFKEASRVIKPGGMLFVRVRSLTNQPPEGAHIVNDVRGRTWVTGPGEGDAPQTIHDFSLEELQDLAKENNLEIIDEPVDERYKPDRTTEPGQWNITFRKKTKS